MGGKFVTLKLGKGEETQEITMKTNSMMDMANKARKLARLNKQGWAVLDVTGNDVEKVAFMKKITGGHVPGAGEMLHEAGLPGMPEKLKKFFKKDKQETDQARE